MSPTGQRAPSISYIHISSKLRLIISKYSGHNWEQELKEITINVGKSFFESLKNFFAPIIRRYVPTNHPYLNNGQKLLKIR